MAEPSRNPPGPPHAARMPHTHTAHAGEDSLAGDKIDAPAACAVPFRPYCGGHTAGVVTRTRNVSEYMLVLALCLVDIAVTVCVTYRNGGLIRLTTSVSYWRFVVLLSGRIAVRAYRCGLFVTDGVTWSVCRSVGLSRS